MSRQCTSTPAMSGSLRTDCMASSTTRQVPSVRRTRARLAAAHRLDGPGLGGGVTADEDGLVGTALDHAVGERVPLVAVVVVRGVLDDLAGGQRLSQVRLDERGHLGRQEFV